MRIQLILEHPANSIVPLNYQYPVSSAIYRLLRYSNPEFSEWLHSKGFMKDKRGFKLFTFGKLEPQKYKIEGNRLTLQQSPSKLTMSFYMDEGKRSVLLSLFDQERFSIYGHSVGTDFEIRRVIILPSPQFYQKMRFTLRQPVSISYQDGLRKTPAYLHPMEDRGLFERQFLQNLVHKYEVYHGKNDRFTNLRDIGYLRILSNRKIHSKLITIKEGGREETKVRGYLFDFEITAPPELIKIGYFAGFGEKGSQGFGFADIIT